MLQRVVDESQIELVVRQVDAHPTLSLAVAARIGDRQSGPGPPQPFARSHTQVEEGTPGPRESHAQLRRGLERDRIFCRPGLVVAQEAPVLVEGEQRLRARGVGPVALRRVGKSVEAMGRRAVAAFLQRREVR